MGTFFSIPSSPSHQIDYLFDVRLDHGLLVRFGVEILGKRFLIN